MNHKLPDTLYSWAWTPHFVRQKRLQQTREESGLILPDGAIALDTDDIYFTHFATIRDGGEYCWLWLFPDAPSAQRLRLLPSVISDPSTDLVEATLPQDPEGDRPTTYLQFIDPKWLLTDLSEFNAVWLGFDYKKFAADRILQASAQTFSPDEFQEFVRRSL